MLPSTSQRLLGSVNRQQIQFVLCPICRAESTTVTPPPLLPVPSERSTKQPSYLGYLATVVSEWIPKLSTTETATKKSDISRVISKKPSRSEVSAKTRALVKKLLCAETAGSLRLRTHELTKHLSEFPPSRVVATQDAALLPFLLQNATHASDEDLIEESRQCLAQCGYVEPPRGRGVSVLAVDGGGTRGMMGLEVLEAIEKLSGKKIGELFDHIVGVSTGAVVAMLVGIKGNAVSECKRIYMDLSREIFKQSSAAGVSGLLTAHSYYNTKKWVKLLETIVGDDTMIQTARREGTPKISIVACVVNLPQLQPFIFRNYEHPSGMDSHFRGSASFRVTEAVQASAAAPGYFEEVTIGDFLLQDGGVLSNNPTAVGLHETRLLWPKDPLHCVISVGNGRTVADLEPNVIVKSTGVQQKLAKLVDSATDTELVHIAMHDLLNRGSYFRLNPYMSYTYGLDEIDPDRLYQMQLDAKNYVRRNMSKIEAATERLLQRPRLVTRLERTVYRVRSIKGW